MYTAPKLSLASREPMTESEIALTKAIGERLRYARVCAELSLSVLSERTGGQFSKARISNYEQGLRRLSYSGP